MSKNLDNLSMIELRKLHGGTDAIELTRAELIEGIKKPKAKEVKKVVDKIAKDIKGKPLFKLTVVKPNGMKVEIESLNNDAAAWVADQLKKMI